nr:immunoglobulin heavy chain junction region [Mus musculus]NSM09623.1 immunoglobulin heavy chain junction region [Mus musculus]
CARRGYYGDYFDYW